ncbi:hypothetical protein PAP_00360 [Palaeococcus pacificus DY20341]|uniref:Uncharacterized protein n=1 Tax=Palaeococcus pacificus DY20341 TaxID=1343739 RepID=A0A075LQC0_9EURY|nr:hypothetical protein [Palaeococcus pacificus]AIF68519.1 hypothetical protein PAP_00360 [Palaeococcus pacificus DY20341]
MRRVLVLLTLLLLSPLTSAGYYVILDEDLATLEPYAQKIADFHNGTLIVSDFSNLSFLQDGDYALFVVDYSKFSADFVYSLYDSLDFDGDGIYNPILGFYPVNSEDGFKSWVKSLTSPMSGAALFVRRDGMSYGEYLTRSQNASLIWIYGHGDPLGVDLITWRFDREHMGNPKGKAFIFESCSVGEVWKTGKPLVLDLLAGGSLAVVASTDMGGVSYLPQELWLSNYSLGKLVQINNAYFMKIGVSPKVVLFGDPALKFSSEKRFTEVSILEAGIFKYLFPEVNGHIYLPSGEKPGTLGGIFLAAKIYYGVLNPVSLWDSIVTQDGIFPLLLLVYALIPALNFKRIRRRDVALSLTASLVVFIPLALISEDGPSSLQVSAKIIILWALALLSSLTLQKMRYLFLLLMLPFLMVIFAGIAGLVSLSYALFVSLVFVIVTVIVSVLLYVLVFGFEAVSRGKKA